ncbi:MAG: trigger factor [Caldilineales bacterium]|nr:trigger factor [Caldilineales bacterium]MDW8317265.1 trigger factor [Anaerolineae bacterium]
MKLTTETLPNRQVALVIEPEQAEVEPALRKVAAQLSQRYPVPGFRKGKAPVSAVLRYFGKEVVYDEVVEAIGDDLYKAALDQIGLEPVAPGALERVTYDPLTLRLVVPLRPEVDLGDYRALRVEVPAVEVSDEQVQAELERLQKSHAEWIAVDDAARSGDLLELRLKATVGDQVLIDDPAFEITLEPENADFPPGFDAQFIGQTVGATLSFDLTYPDDWPSDRAGQTMHVEAEVLGIKRLDLPPLDDSFAVLVGDYETLDDLRTAVRKTLADAQRRSQDEEYANRVLEKVIEGARIEFPPALVEEEIDRLVRERQSDLARMGLPFNEYLRIMRMDERRFRESLRGRAEMRLKAELVLEKVAEVEGLAVTDDEIQQELAEVVAAGERQGTDLRSWLDSPGGRAILQHDLRHRKALRRLVEIARGEAPEPAAPPQEPVSDAEAA